MLCVWEFHLAFTPCKLKNCSHFHSRSQLLVPFHRLYVCMCGWVLPLGDVCSDDQFVCYFLHFNVYLILFCVLFSHRFAIIIFSVFIFFFQCSINAKHDSRNAIFYLLVISGFILISSELFCFFLSERELEKLMHANKCYLLLSYVGVTMIVSFFVPLFHFAFRWKLIKIVFLIKSNCK